MYQPLRTNGRHTPSPAKLALEDGLVLTGVAAGHIGETSGELCFNTSMTGYQEILTDPSYYGQLIIMTYPHIGNYGTRDADLEASRPMAAGLVVRSFCDTPSNHSSESPLQTFMANHELVGISNVDTRRLVLHIRAHGVMNAVISSVDLDDESLIRKARAVPSMEGLELASRVTTESVFDYCESTGPRIGVYDFGVKRNILRSFQQRNCSVRVYPASTPVAEVLAWEPDGLFLSNGPGDPRAMPESVEAAGILIRSGIPLFGICLGHQLLALAEGLDVYKMRVGHRGANQPVRQHETGRVQITSQNHGFSVRWDDSMSDVAEVTHTNLNDRTLEGLRYKSFKGFSVQYHPEASPGPHDSRYLFDEFMDMLHADRRNRTENQPDATYHENPPTDETTA